MATSSGSTVQPHQLEQLEDRTLMSVSVASTRILDYYFDNRGLVVMNWSQGLNTATLSRKVAAIYTAGADGKFNTADDVRLYTAVGYRKGQLTLQAAITAGQKYRVKLNSAVIRDANGYAIDAEFRGTSSKSGNGKAGGDLDVVLTAPASTKYVRYWTNQGNINVRLYTNINNTVNNFLSYANKGAWDGTFFHRSATKAAKGFGIIQGGGFKLNSSGGVDAITAGTGIATEAVNSNTKGTLAMANTGQPNSNTNQWYFNVTDNAAAFDGGYSVFGVVSDTRSQTVLDTINGLPIKDYSGGNANNPFGEVPTIPPNDYVVNVSRVALQMDAASTPAPSAVPATSAAAVKPATTLFATAPLARNSVLE